MSTGTETTARSAQTRHATSQNPWTTLVEDVVGVAPMPVSVHFEGSTEIPRLSDAELAALSRASLEALRNAHRHGGADHAELVLSVAPQTVRVSVVDRGRGVGPNATPGFGIRESIVAAMEAVGGSADLTETPGGGTTVLLEVPHGTHVGRSRLVDSYDLTFETSRSRRRMVRAVALPLTVAWTYLAIRHSMSSPDRVTMLLLAGAILVTTAVIAHRTETRPASAAWVVGAALWLITLQAVGILAMPHSGMLDFTAWSIGFTGVPLILLIFPLPVRDGLLISLPHPVLLIGTLLGAPELSNNHVPWGAVNAILTTPLLAIVLGWLLRQAGRTLRAERTSLTQASMARAAQVVSTRVTSLHLDHTRRVVLPWLAGVASGRIPYQGEAAQRHARILGLEARDDLYAPGFFDAELRARVSSFRAKGGVVDIRPGFPPGTSRRLTGAVLAHLVAALDPPHTITLSHSATNDSVRVALVPAATPALCDELVRAHPDTPLCVDGDWFRTVISFADTPLSGERSHPTQQGIMTP